MAGHSRWTQIKHKKALTDAKKSQRFSKIIREILAAARDNPDPQSNTRLRTVVDRARDEGVPKENIERAIARAAGPKDHHEDLDEFLVEAVFPGGVMLLIEGMTDNKNRTLAEIRHTLLRHGASLASPGSVVWNFEKVGVITLPREENAPMPDDEILLAAIDAGAEDVEHTGSNWTVKTKFNALPEVLAQLESRGIHVAQARHDFMAQRTVAVDNDSIISLLEALGLHDDVEEVYTNISL